MNSLTESHMRIGLPRDIEPLGVGELRRVAVGGTVEHHNGHMWAQVRPAQLAFLIAMPPGGLHGAVPSQYLLDRAREQRGVAAQQLKLLGMAQQRVKPVTDKIAGGLGAGQEQQVEEPGEFIETQRVLFFRLNQGAYQTGARIAPQFLVAGVEISAFGSQGFVEPRRRRGAQGKVVTASSASAQVLKLW